MPDPVGAVLSLRRDPDNVFDENAIAVHNGEDCSPETHIGYLPRDLVKLVSGWARAGRGTLGVHGTGQQWQLTCGVALDRTGWLPNCAVTVAAASLVKCAAGGLDG